ncbi:MAG: RNA 2',3'-cyclic phosphodiesterase [Propionibacteriaceae bacterium]|jgi:2'-5' RNA ligase|nr:RNA 2',3'-cyclic phosphodiesterase [Propionibacteriaceae bacterium]
MRLFVGIRLNAELAAALEAVQQQLRAQGVRARYTRFDNLHLTLAFIGETPFAAEAEAAMARVCAAEFNVPLRLSLSHFGFFHGRGGDTIWVGLGEDPALISFQSALVKELLAAGFDIERRKFRPHVTLARQADSQDAWVEVPERSMFATEVALIRSEVTKAGREYTDLASFACPSYSQGG